MVEKKQNKIPKSTVSRLPLYHRYLQMYYDSGKLRVSSKELSEAVKVNSATIRRDFSYFGELGKRGYGYDVKYILDFFSKTLNQGTLTNVALIGLGHLGNALLSYNFHQKENIRISAAFDVDPDIVGTVKGSVPVYHIDDLEKQINDQQLEVAILTVPLNKAQEIADILNKTGLKGILNFTPVRLSVVDTIRVQNVDLTNELQTLIYFIDNN